MLQTMSMKRLATKRYKLLGFTGAFADSFGQPQAGSRWLILGKPKQGKTELCIQLFKYMIQFGKAAYYSREQGDSRSLQMAAIRNELDKLPKTKAILLHGGTYEELVVFLAKSKTIKTVVIDSIDYLALTVEQVKYLDDTFKDKTLIFISWSQGKNPKTAAGKALLYIVSIIMDVENYVASPRSRYGGDAPYIIWHDRAKQHHPFLNI